LESYSDNRVLILSGGPALGIGAGWDRGRVERKGKEDICLMKFSRLLGTFLLAFCIFGAARLDCQAVQYDYAPLETLPAGANPSDYIALGMKEESYIVRPGDTLWGISRRFWGTGTKYERILQENQEMISDAELLMPGDVLALSEKLYIPRDRYDRGGLRTAGFHIATPDMVQHSYFLENDMDVDNAASTDISVYSLPVTNTMGENALTATEEDWEAFMTEAIRCSETCGGRVSALRFEKYTLEDGCDLCGYSFDFDLGGAIKEYVVFYRFGRQNMVEVIGKRSRGKGEEQDTMLIDVTRYIAASFEDFGGKAGMGYAKMADYVGAYDWNYPELHNPFTSAMKNYVGGAAERPKENHPEDYEIVWAEPRFEQAVRNSLIELWKLTDEEKEAFLSRPVMASDLAVITDISCTLYKPGNWHADDDPESKGGPVLYISLNGHMEKIYPGEETGFSYEDLGWFREAKELEIWNCGVKDYSFISNLMHLKSLSLMADETVEDISFLASLKEMRTLQLLGVYSGVKGKPAGFLEITDLSVLKNCKELRYLCLRSPQVTDYSFLKECPEICTLNLSGEWNGQEPVLPDLELLPNARFLEFYGESYRFES